MYFDSISVYVKYFSLCDLQMLTRNKGTFSDSSHGKKKSTHSAHRWFAFPDGRWTSRPKFLHKRSSIVRKDAHSQIPEKHSVVTVEPGTFQENKNGISHDTSPLHHPFGISSLTQWNNHITRA